MMARLSLATLLSTLLFIQTSLAMPFGGWFKHHAGAWGNGTEPAFPTAFPTATGGAVPTGYYGKRHGHFKPSGVVPSGGFPSATGAFPTAYPTGFSGYQHNDAEVEAEVVQRRYEGALKAKRFGHHWGFGGSPHHPAGSYPTGTAFPTAAAFATGTAAFATGTAGPTAFPTAY